MGDFTPPTAVERLFNKAFGMLVGLGVGLPHNFVLEVRGRRTGRRYSVPVNALVLDGRRFLVAPRGDTSWVRNALASGMVTLRKGRRREELRVRPLSADEKPAVLKAYLDRFTLTVQRYFPIPAGSPEAAFQPLVDRYPAFELEAKR
jgi:deazaflavin-dependent oxidoreductase (nitroreductase family)